jgi:hypothetical protein
MRGKRVRALRKLFREVHHRGPEKAEVETKSRIIKFFNRLLKKKVDAVVGESHVLANNELRRMKNDYKKDRSANRRKRVAHA